MDNQTLNQMQEQRVKSLLSEAESIRDEARALFSDVSVASVYYDQLPGVKHKVHAFVMHQRDADKVVAQVVMNVQQNVARLCRMFFHRYTDIEGQWHRQSSELHNATENIGTQMEAAEAAVSIDTMEKITKILSNVRDTLGRIKASIYVLCHEDLLSKGENR